MQRHDTADDEDERREDADDALAVEQARRHALVRDAQAQKRDAVEQEDEQERQPTEQRVGAQKIPERSLIDHVVVNRDACEQIRDGDAPEQGRKRAADGDGPVEAMAPEAVVVLAAQFKTRTAQNQREQHEEEREVERGKHRRIGVRERREQRTARRDHPDFVAVPDRRDRAQDFAALLLIGGEEGQDAADAVVEALEEEEAREEYRDEDEPENVEIHHAFLPSSKEMCVFLINRMATQRAAMASTR